MNYLCASHMLEGFQGLGDVDAGDPVDKRCGETYLYGKGEVTYLYGCLKGTDRDRQ